MSVSDIGSPDMGNDAGDAGRVMLSASTAAEKRSEFRITSIFRLCCIETEDEAYLGVVRNISVGGAQIQTDKILPVGTRLSYYWDGLEPVIATVVWCKDDRIGIQHASRFLQFDRSQPTRAVRVPCKIPAKVWIDGVARECLVSDLSVSGLGGCGIEGLKSGDMITVSVAGRLIHSATVRWTQTGKFGIVFQTALSPQKVMDILGRTANKGKMVANNESRATAA